MQKCRADLLDCKTLLYPEDHNIVTYTVCYQIGASYNRVLWLGVWTLEPILSCAVAICNAYKGVRL